MQYVLLPGMGATAAMYNGLKRKLEFPVDFLSWPPYRGEKTYADVARRIIGEHAITGNDVVGGSSLGGMVALEIARLTKRIERLIESSAALFFGRTLKATGANQLQQASSV